MIEPLTKLCFVLTALGLDSFVVNLRLRLGGRGVKHSGPVFFELLCTGGE